MPLSLLFLDSSRVILIVYTLVMPTLDLTLTWIVFNPGSRECLPTPVVILEVLSSVVAKTSISSILFGTTA
jgi:hypothetical protein